MREGRQAQDASYLSGMSAGTKDLSYAGLKQQGNVAQAGGSSSSTAQGNFNPQASVDSVRIPNMTSMSVASSAALGYPHYLVPKEHPKNAQKR